MDEFVCVCAGEGVVVATTTCDIGSPQNNIHNIPSFFCYLIRTKDISRSIPAVVQTCNPLQNRSTFYRKV